MGRFKSVTASEFATFRLNKRKIEYFIIYMLCWSLIQINKTLQTKSFLGVFKAHLAAMFSLKYDIKGVDK